MKTTKIVRLLYRKTHTNLYITRPDPFVRWSAYDSMRDDETTMQLKRTTKRKYFSDPAQFRSYFGAALQARRLRGSVYVSPFSPKKRNHASWSHDILRRGRLTCGCAFSLPLSPIIYFIFFLYFYFEVVSAGMKAKIRNLTLKKTTKNDQKEYQYQYVFVINKLWQERWPAFALLFGSFCIWGNLHRLMLLLFLLLLYSFFIYLSSVSPASIWCTSIYLWNLNLQSGIGRTVSLRFQKRRKHCQCFSRILLVFLHVHAESNPLLVLIKISTQKLGARNSLWI